MTTPTAASCPYCGGKDLVPGIGHDDNDDCIRSIANRVAALEAQPAMSVPAVTPAIEWSYRRCRDVNCQSPVRLASRYCEMGHYAVPAKEPAPAAVPVRPWGKPWVETTFAPAPAEKPPKVEPPRRKPIRSSADVPPREGMRILLARWTNGQPTGYTGPGSPIVAAGTTTPLDSYSLTPVKPWPMWDAGCYDILSFPPAPVAAEPAPTVEAPRCKSCGDTGVEMVDGEPVRHCLHGATTAPSTNADHAGCNLFGDACSSMCPGTPAPEPPRADGQGTVKRPRTARDYAHKVWSRYCGVDHCQGCDDTAQAICEASNDWLDASEATQCDLDNLQTQLENARAELAEQAARDKAQTERLSALEECLAEANDNINRTVERQKQLQAELDEMTTDRDKWRKERVDVGIKLDLYRARNPEAAPSPAPVEATGSNRERVTVVLSRYTLVVTKDSVLLALINELTDLLNDVAREAAKKALEESAPAPWPTPEVEAWRKLGAKAQGLVREDLTRSVTGTNSKYEIAARALASIAGGGK